MKSEDQQPVVGAAGLGDRDQRQPGLAACAGSARAQQQPRPPAPARRSPAPGKSPASRQSAASPTMAASDAAVDLAASAPPRRARAAEEADAVGLDEAGRGQRRGQRQQAARGRHQKLQAALRQLRALQHRLEHQPFGDEAVERRQRRDGDAADQQATAVTGMRWISPPSRSRSRVPVAVSTAPAPRNSRLLNSQWLKRMEQRRRQRQRRRGGHAVGAEGQREAERRRR